jgi:fluoroacetyl-CoA thioesterase
MTLRIRGEVTAVEGRCISFRVEAWDDVERVCEGTHERHLIDPVRFNDKVAQKIAKAGQ